MSKIFETGAFGAARKVSGGSRPKPCNSTPPPGPKSCNSTHPPRGFQTPLHLVLGRSWGSGHSLLYPCPWLSLTSPDTRVNNLGSDGGRCPHQFPPNPDLVPISNLGWRGKNLKAKRPKFGVKGAVLKKCLQNLKKSINHFLIQLINPSQAPLAPTWYPTISPEIR